MKTKNNFGKYGFEGDFEGEIFKQENDYFHGLVINNIQYPKGNLEYHKWDRDGSVLVGFNSNKLTLLKPKWYEDANNFPALIKHKHTGSWAMVQSYNKKGKCRILHSQKFVTIDEYEFIDKTKLLNFTMEHQDSRSEMVDELQKKLHNCMCDLDDYSGFTSVYRCPCCSHLISRGLVCLNCGCDSGLFLDNEYSEDELNTMKAKSKRIK